MRSPARAFAAPLEVLLEALPDAGAGRGAADVDQLVTFPQREDPGLLRRALDHDAREAVLRISYWHSVSAGRLIHAKQRPSRGKCRDLHYIGMALCESPESAPW